MNRVIQERKSSLRIITGKRPVARIIAWGSGQQACLHLTPDGLREAAHRMQDAADEIERGQR